MARGVVHRALHAAVVTIGWLTGVFVTSRTATAPTRRCSCGGERSGQWPIAASLLLVVVAAVAIATTWGLVPGAGRALPFCRLGGWGVPDVAFRSPGALVRQTEERGHILDVVGGKLLQHLLIPYPW
jgi:hypothetical protein